jgi:hypothetical protein
MEVWLVMHFDSPISAALVAPNHDGQVARCSQPTPPPNHAVMSDHEDDDVAKAMGAVQTAYSDLQALRTSRKSKMPPSLSDTDKVLLKIRDELDGLTDSTRSLSIFREYAMKEMGSSVETPLSDAIVHDMKAIAAYFRHIKHVDPTKRPDDLDEQKCGNIKDMVERYETVVSAVSNRHKTCVRNESTQCMYLIDPS